MKIPKEVGWWKSTLLRRFTDQDLVVDELKARDADRGFANTALVFSGGDRAPQSDAIIEGADLDTPTIDSGVTDFPVDSHGLIDVTIAAALRQSFRSAGSAVNFLPGVSILTIGSGRKNVSGLILEFRRGIVQDQSIPSGVEVERHGRNQVPDIKIALRNHDHAQNPATGNIQSQRPDFTQLLILHVRNGQIQHPTAQLDITKRDLGTAVGLTGGLAFFEKEDLLAKQAISRGNAITSARLNPF